jgi:hypothetical protein
MVLDLFWKKGFDAEKKGFAEKKKGSSLGLFTLGLFRKKINKEE